MIRAIIDTNVLMSGIFWSGTPAKILDAWQKEKIKMIISPDILDEYTRVSQILAIKYPGIDIDPIIELVTVFSELYIPKQLLSPISRDPDDDKFIALAIAANCKIIVTGDGDLLDIDANIGIECIKPGNFINKYLCVDLK